MGKGKREWNIFFTLRRLRGGCERKAVAGGGELAMMFGVSPPPKNSLARIFTPPRKRRRVELVVGRFPPSREWKKGAGIGKGGG